MESRKCQRQYVEKLGTNVNAHNMKKFGNNPWQLTG